MAQCPNVHVHNVLADDSPQADFIHGFGHRQHIVVNFVDGGHAALHALPCTQQRKMVNVVGRQLALHRQRKAVKAIGVVLQQAFKQAARHVGVRVYNAGQNGFACGVYYGKAGPLAGVAALAHGRNPVALYQHIAFAVQRVIVVYRNNDSVFK